MVLSAYAPHNATGEWTSGGKAGVDVIGRLIGSALGIGALDFWYASAFRFFPRFVFQKSRT